MCVLEERDEYDPGNTLTVSYKSFLEATSQYFLLYHVQKLVTWPHLAAECTKTYSSYSGQLCAKLIIMWKGVNG